MGGALRGRAAVRPDPDDGADLARGDPRPAQEPADEGLDEGPDPGDVAAVGPERRVARADDRRDARGLLDEAVAPDERDVRAAPEEERHDVPPPRRRVVGPPRADERLRERLLDERRRRDLQEDASPSDAHGELLGARGDLDDPMRSAPVVRGTAVEAQRVGAKVDAMS